MAHKVGATGRVIAFEPVPSVYDVPCENLHLNGCNQARVECKAVADGKGEARMQSEAGNPLSFTTRLYGGGDFTVPVVSIDYYAEWAGLTRLDFVKIDVEGAEDAVIRGMTKALQIFRPVVLVEIHANDGGESEGLGRLKDAGYRLDAVTAHGLAECDSRRRGGHVLATYR